MCSWHQDYDSGYSYDEECLSYKDLCREKENCVDIMQLLLDKLYSDKQINIAELEDVLENLAHYFDLKIPITELRIARTKDTITALKDIVHELNLARAM